MRESDIEHLVDRIQDAQAELQTVEVKAAHEGCPKRLFDTLSAFSNQDEGGVIVFGLDESRSFEVVGVHDVQDLQKDVTSQCNQMEPPVRPLFSVGKVQGHYVVTAEIPALDLADRPCFYRGKGRTKGSYRRVGEADEPMTEYEIYSYEAFRKKYQDDVRVVSGADAATLDSDALQAYVAHLKKAKPNLAKLNDDQIYDLTGVKRDGGITLSAELLFGLYPQAFAPQLCIVAVSVPGVELGEEGLRGERFIDNRRIEGTIPDMLSEALRFVRTNMKTRTVVDAVTGERTDVPEYPVEAVREIVLNALVHRDYSVHTEGMPIQISMFEDRMEVRNPGGLYGRLRIDQLGHVQPDTRNPVLATAMETLGLTENRYSGIPTIRRLMSKAGLMPPEFVDAHDSFLCVLRKAAQVAISGGGTKRGDLAAFCAVPRSRAEIAAFLGLSSPAYAMREYVTPAVRAGVLKMTIPEKPRSSRQRYVAVASEPGESV